MKLKCFFTVLVWAFTYNLYAQQHTINPFLAQLLKTQSNCTKAKVTGMERLAAESTYGNSINGFGLLDSNKLFYSNGRSSQFDYVQLQYDYFHTSPMYFIYDRLAFPLHYVQLDQLLNYQPEVSGIPVFQRKYWAEYTGSSRWSIYSSKNMRSDTQVINPTEQIQFDYDGTGNKISQNKVSVSSLGITPVDKTVFYYDNQNRLVTDTSFSYSNGTWNRTGKDEFEYDIQGKLKLHRHYIWVPISIDFNLLSKDSFTYNQNQQIQTFYSVNYDQATPGVITTRILDSMKYGTSGNLFTSLKQYEDVGTGSFNLSINERMHLLPTGLPDTIELSNGVIKVFSYDGFDNPTEQKEYHGSTLHSHHKYYYEQFFSNSIAPQETVSFNVDLFPDPVANNFQIRSDQKINTVSIMSADGKLMALYKNPGANTIYTTQELSNGTYFVLIAMPGFTSKKKIIVQH